MLADYIEETTTSIAGTNGNGAVTLTQITGRPRISSALGTAARVVRYVIEDTVNFYFEQGIGSAASNVLTRTTPRVTWNGTTYDDVAPSPLAFGSSPASGDIVIRMAPLADTAVQTVPYLNVTATGTADVGLACGAMHTSENQSTVTMANGTEIWFPFQWTGSGEVVQFALRVTTLASSTNIKAALNEVNTSGLPGEKLVDFGSVSGASTGVKTTTSASWSPAADIKLAPGWYYIGLVSDGAPVIAGFTRHNASPLGTISAYSLAAARATRSGSYASGLGSSPASLSLSTSSTRPHVWLKPRN